MPPDLCDYCSQPLDLESDDTVFVRIDRRVDPLEGWDPDGSFAPTVPVLLSFDSQAHLVAWMSERRLPPVQPVDEPPWGVRDTLGCGAAVIGAFVLVSGAVFGFIDFIRTVWL